MVLDDGKEPITDIDSLELTNVTEGAVEQKLGTKYDQRDMLRMGKRQELRRNFHFFSIWGYAVILGNTWEWSLASGVFSLTNGGTAGAIWMFLAVCFGMFFVMLSLAEIASMAPTAGGQYHWVSELCPKSCQRGISYVVGWFSLLGWQTSLVGTSYASSQQYMAMVALSDVSYEIKGWHGCLFTIALTAVALFFNTTLFRKFPLIQGIFVSFHIVGFFAVVITLWATGPRGGAETVTTFSNNGWSSNGLSCLVGILSPVITLVGADSQSHLAEELHDAAYTLPRAMFLTAISNYLMGFIMVLTIMFTIGPDADAVLNTPLGVPWVQVMFNATNSYTASMLFACLVGLLMTCCLINNVTTASRQLWSFARDGGVPFASFFAKVQPGWDIPINAMTFTFGITLALSLFIIGSPVAFSILTSLSLTGLISSYLGAVVSVLWKRFRREPLPPGRFNLGKFGFVCNSIAVCFLLLVWVMMFFPTAPHPGTVEMNWSVVIYVLVVVLFTVYYFMRGRKQYSGPVVHVRRDI